MLKKKMIGITVVVIGFIGFCVWFLSGVGSTYYYAEIDNNKIEQGDSHGGVINYNRTKYGWKIKSSGGINERI